MEESYQQKRNRILNEVKLELRTNPAIQQYLEQFSAASANSFLDYYAEQKATWLAFSPIISSIEQRGKREDINLGWEMLWLVQLKKLLNLEIRWRAELVTIPGIQVTDDFLRLMGTALETHVVPPVSEKEFDLVMSHIDSRESLSQDYDELWYWDLVDPSSPSYFTDKYPQFYRKYDATFGTADIIGLPDLRGEKEERYRKAWQKLSGTEPKPYVPVVVPNMKPYFSPYHDEHDFVGQYLNRFESPENQALLRQTIEVRRRSRPYNNTDEYISRIQEMGIPVHLTAQSNIPDAVRLAYDKVKLINTSRLLPGIYKEYRQAWEEKKPMPYENSFAFLITRESNIYEYRAGREALGLAFDGYV